MRLLRYLRFLQRHLKLAILFERYAVFLVPCWAVTFVTIATKLFWKLLTDIYNKLIVLIN